MSQKMFAKLQMQIANLVAQQQSMATLGQHLKSDYFDEEDRQMVQQKLLDIAETKRQLEITLVRKQEIYKNQIQGLETQLQRRQKVLESVDKKQSLFKEFPDVLEYFAKKQSRLNETLISIKDQLQT
jgi:prolyl oligopeptidase PreP (S9A serine peptidase family)